MNWQPIETAPKDGTLIRLKHEAHPEYGDHLMEWKSGKWVGLYPGIMGWVRICWDENAPQPTHWMPLPDPPAAR